MRQKQSTTKPQFFWNTSLLLTTHLECMCKIKVGVAAKLQRENLDSNAQVWTFEHLNMFPRPIMKWMFIMNSTYMYICNYTFIYLMVHVHIHMYILFYIHLDFRRSSEKGWNYCLAPNSWRYPGLCKFWYSNSNLEYF